MLPRLLEQVEGDMPLPWADAGRPPLDPVLRGAVVALQAQLLRGKRGASDAAIKARVWNKASEE